MRSGAGRLRSRSRPAVWVGEGETQAQMRQRRGFSRDESLERERAEPAVALLGASACASDALGKCRLAVWVGEGETRRPDAAAKGILKGQVP